MTASHNDDDRTQTHVILTKGTMVSHYRIVKEIGAGGMGIVFLADDTELKRQVALKFLPPHLCKDEEFRERFRREAQAAARLSHPNIITVHEVSEHKGRPFFAMEHVQGQTLTGEPTAEPFTAHVRERYSAKMNDRFASVSSLQFQKLVPSDAPGAGQLFRMLSWNTTGQNFFHEDIRCESSDGDPSAIDISREEEVLSRSLIDFE